eukprot:jgi/Mesvir1/15864/Mv03410-RA.2
MVTFETFPTYSSTVFAHPAAELAVSVGAAFYGDTPAFNPNLTSAILEPYSSKGGTRILFDEQGNHLGPRGVIRATPSVVGPDGGDTTFFYSGDVEGNGHPNFFGTSASSPHVTGLAALFLSMVKPYVPVPSPAALRTMLQTTAVDYGEPGVDPLWGSGFVDGPRLFKLGLVILRDHERSVLLAFKGGVDAAGELVDWVDGTDVCGWTGVTCMADAPHLVTGLVLANRGLGGTVSAALADLPVLKVLDLSANAFSGSIPEELGQLSNVETINLSSNQLVGSIPPSFNQLTRLRVLDVHDNAGLTGCIPYLLAGVTDASGTSIPDGPGRACGDTIEGAILVPFLPFSTEGDIRPFTRNYDYGAACAGAGSSSPDVVFEVTAQADGILTASLCGSSFDTLVTIASVADNATQACNDDFALCDSGGSEVEALVTAGSSYYVIVSGAGDAQGAFQLRLTLAPPPSPAEVSQERAALREFWDRVSPLLADATAWDWANASVCEMGPVFCRGGRVAALDLYIGEADGSLSGLMQQPLLDLTALERVSIHGAQALVGCTLGVLRETLMFVDVDGRPGMCGDSAEDPVIIPSLPFVYRDDTSRGFGRDAPVRGCRRNEAADVIFVYTANVTAAVKVSTCTPYLREYDSYIHVLEEYDGVFKYPLCDDDGCGLVGGLSTLNMVVEAGREYIIVVAGYEKSSGPFRLDIAVDDSINMTWVAEQRDALLAFKDGVEDPYSNLNDWTGYNYCSWYGVYCAAPGLTIDVVDVSGFYLSGPVSPALGELRDLHVLNLGYNNLAGTIPPALAGPLGEGEEERFWADLVFEGNVNMTGCVPDVIVNKTNTEGELLFWVFTSGTGIGGACGLVNFKPTVTCPETLLLANVTSALTYVPYEFETEGVTLSDIQAPNIFGDQPSVTCSPPSWSPFFEGTTPVVCRAADLDGNEANCTFDVIVTLPEDPLVATPPRYLTLVVVDVNTPEVGASAFTPAVWADLITELHAVAGFESVTIWRARADDTSAQGTRRKRSLLQGGGGGVRLTIHLGTSTADEMASVEAWFRAAASAALMQGVLSVALGVAVDPVTLSVRSGSGGACCLPPSPDPVCVVNPDAPIASSDECQALGLALLPTARQDAIWLGRVGQCGECAAVWDRAGATGDPHFVTAMGEHFDWMGQGDRSFCIISDKAVHVNAHMFAGTDGRRKGTWIDQIAVLHGGEVVVVSTGAPSGLPGLHGSVIVNGRPEMYVGSSSSAVVAKGLTVRRKKTRTWVTVDGIMDLEVEVVRASTWEAGKGPGRDFLNFRVHGLNATESVHGVLGQTFRATAQGAAKSALKGLVQGADPDYITSGLLAADCSFAQFVPVNKLSEV